MAPVDIQRVWLTEDAYTRIKVEHATLLVARYGYGVENGDPEAGGPSRDMDDGAAIANWRHRELRIRQLKELIQSGVVLQPPDDGVAEPGMVLTVRYDGNDSTETFPMVDRQEAAQAGQEVWTPAGAWNPAHRRDSRTTTYPADRKTMIKITRL